jgi:hypothetical protein
VGGSAPRARADSVRPRRLVSVSGRPLNFTVRSQMRGSFLAHLPDWVQWLFFSAVLSALAALAVQLRGPRPRPEAPPADYEQLRVRYEFMSRVTGVVFFFGVLWGIYFSIDLDYHRVHYGVLGGTGALAATCYFALAMSMKSGRSWREYLRYEDSHGRFLGLPAIAYMYLMCGFLVWGVLELLLMLHLGPNNRWRGP